MQIIQSRRDFLASLSAAGAAGVLGARGALADEGPPEVTTICLKKSLAICFAPLYVVEPFLHAEGFTDVQYLSSGVGLDEIKTVERGDVDIDVSFAGLIVHQLDAGFPITALGGLHVGCYELFASEPISHHQRLEGPARGHRLSGRGRAPVHLDHGD